MLQAEIMPVVGLQLLRLYRRRKTAAMRRNTTKARAGTRSAYGAADRAVPRQARNARDTDHLPVVEWELEDGG
jgi:hypothetical protein